MRGRRPLTALGGALALLCCGDLGGAPAAPGAADGAGADAGADAAGAGDGGAAGARLTHVLAWDRGRVTAAAVGWRTTSDLGYAVHLERGYLVTYGVQLVPCAPAALEDARRGEAPRGLWQRLFGGGPARAGHVSASEEPTASAPHIEDFDALEPSVIEVPAFVPGSQYCNAHYLLARADEGADPFPEDVDMWRISLHLEGRWWAPGAAAGDPGTAFEVRTNLAHGALFALDPPVDLGAAGATRLTWTRDAGACFDGVDFAALDEAGLARAVLEAVVAAVRVEVSAGP